MPKSCLFLLLAFVIFANHIYPQDEKPDINYIHQLAEQLYEAKADSLKIEINEQLEIAMANALASASINQSDFDSLTFLKALDPTKGEFRLITWAYPLSDDGYNYSGFLQFFDKEDLQDTIIKLEYKKTGNQVMKALSSNEWPGAVYYKLIERQSGKKKTYTLFGWIGAGKGKALRVIEILDFYENANINCGKPIFVMDDKKIQARVIFEYTREVPFHLKYEKHPLPGKKKKAEMIVFNRLAGNNPQMGRMYKAIVPDYSTYDGLIFENGKWVLYRDLDLRVNTDKLMNKPPKNQGLSAPKK